MNNTPIIKIENITKEYQLYNSPADRVKEVIHPFRKKYHHTFSALKNISFTINKGEFFGVIGRNGSGKSTLLQLICGILQPSSGNIIVDGKIAALLELGAGFNPEFTGKQNVYLNGAILGFSEDEITARYSEIVEFADIGEFIDQPVKTYSSGMYVRLAFAVQACVNPDILIVDEALAVGDIFFRQKCYARLQSLLKKGCTVILVSHALNDIEQFCDRALLLDEGAEFFLGSATEAVKRYYLLEQQDNCDIAQINVTSPGPEERVQQENEAIEEFFWPGPEAFLDISRVNQVSNGWAVCKNIAVCDVDGSPCVSFQQGDIASFFYEFKLHHDIEVPTGGLEFMNDKGVIVHGKSTLEYGTKVPDQVLKNRFLRYRQNITLDVAPGEYLFNVGIGTISVEAYKKKHLFTHFELDAKLIKVCLLPSVGYFAVKVRSEGTPVKLKHHGIANLPGNCQITTI
jgi:lipopolysaccharide transport system ATP-binding protein